MSIQVAFQQTVRELYTISPYLNFRLPDNAKSINQQVKQLLLVEHQLRIIKENVFQTFGMGGSSRTDQAYQILIDLIEQMRLAALHLRLLTEERLIDPEGTQACFQTKVTKHFELLTWIKSLKVISLTQSSIINLRNRSFKQLQDSELNSLTN